MQWYCSRTDLAAEENKLPPLRLREAALSVCTETGAESLHGEPAGTTTNEKKGHGSKAETSHATAAYSTLLEPHSLQVCPKTKTSCDCEGVGIYSEPPKTGVQAIATDPPSRRFYLRKINKYTKYLSPDYPRLPGTR